MKNDFCTLEGARRLSTVIRQYWLDRGHDVEIDLVKANFVPAMRSVRVDIRSDMRNGAPCRPAGNDKQQISSYG